MVVVEEKLAFSHHGIGNHHVKDSSHQQWHGTVAATGILTQSSVHLTPNRIEPEFPLTIAGMTLYHPVIKKQPGGTTMRNTHTNFESIPALGRPPSQKLCGPVARNAGMKVYCGRCGKDGLINFKTGYCLGCKRKVMKTIQDEIDPGT